MHEEGTMRKIRLALATLMLSLAAACGGGGGAAPPGPPPVQDTWDQMSWDQGEWA